MVHPKVKTVIIYPTSCHLTHMLMFYVHLRILFCEKNTHTKYIFKNVYATYPYSNTCKVHLWCLYSKKLQEMQCPLHMKHQTSFNAISAETLWGLGNWEGSWLKPSPEEALTSGNHPRPELCLDDGEQPGRRVAREERLSEQMVMWRAFTPLSLITETASAC